MRIAVLRAAERCPPFTVQRVQADLRERLSNSDDVDSSRRSRPKPGLALLAFRPVGPTKVRELQRLAGGCEVPEFLR